MSIIHSEQTGYAVIAVILIVSFLIGAAVFSFLNLVIERLPDKGKQIGAHPHENDGAKPAGMFSGRKLFVVILGGLLAVLVVYYYDVSLAALTMFLLYCVLTVITFIDMDTQEIPPVLNIMIFLLGIVSIWTMGGVTIVERIIGFFCISLPLYLIILVIPDGFGGGDIKMMAAAGWFLGWKATLFAFFVGLVMGGIYGVYLLAAKNMDKKAHFAFGPFLAVGIAISAYGGIGVQAMNLYLAPIIQSIEQMNQM